MLEMKMKAAEDENVVRVCQNDHIIKIPIQTPQWYQPTINQSVEK
jgi:hypothetical protein